MVFLWGSNVLQRKQRAVLQTEREGEKLYQRLQGFQGCPACGPQAACCPGWLWMWSNTQSQIYLKQYNIFVCVITCHSVFNVWPKTTLLPVWCRDAKRLDTPDTLSCFHSPVLIISPKGKMFVMRGRGSCCTFYFISICWVILYLKM